jgi:hypothetical protein
MILVVLMKINKSVTVEPLFKIYKKTVHLFIDRRLRSCTCFWRLKKLSQVLSQQTNDSSSS